MSDDAVQRRFVERFNLRIGPAMSRYVAEKLRAGEAGEIAVIGGDARTGVARREIIPAGKIETELK